MSNLSFERFQLNFQAHADAARVADHFQAAAEMLRHAVEMTQYKPNAKIKELWNCCNQMLALTEPLVRDLRQTLQSGGAL